MMEAWWRDVRLSLRSLRRSPGFYAVAVLTLAVGIGASTSVFSVVETILLRPLPFPEPDALVMVWENDRATGTTRENASTSDYYDFAERAGSFEGLAMYALSTSVLTRPDAAAVQLNTAEVGSNLADVLGLPMQLGRTFTPAEDRPDGPTVTVLTDRVWREAFGADPAILGRVLTIDDLAFEVVGVLPAGIDYPASETDLWVPIRQSPAIATRHNHWVRVVGRLRPGATVASAQAEMTRIMAELEVEFAQDNTNRGAFVERLSDVGRADLRLTLWVLFGAVLAVLAIACMNVANLLLVRGAGRARELAVLSAIGAGGRQIARRFLIEGVVVAALAGTLGVVLALAGVKALTAMAPADLLVLGEPQVHAPVLAFALVVSAVVGVGFGLVPTLQAGRLDLQEHLKDGRATGSSPVRLGFRRLLVALQLSLAVVLLLASVLLIRTLTNLNAVDPGFSVANTLRMDLVLPDSRYPADFATYPDWPEIHQFMASTLEEVEAVPGVRSAAVLLNHSLDPGFTNSFRIEGVPYDPSQGEMTTRLVTPGYFATAEVELVDGRLLSDADRIGSPEVVVLNRAAVGRYFPMGGAIGSRIAFWGPTFREVVGIVENERVQGLAAEPPPAMYVSMLQTPPRGGRITLMARTEVPPLSLVDGIRRAVRNVDPEVPLFNVHTMEATLRSAMARERFASRALSTFAAVAVFLALLGVHGVLSYLVSQRSHEVGVRMAMGASRSDVVRMVLRQGTVMTVAGVGVGLVAALAFSGLMQGILYEVRATTPSLYLATGAATVLAAFGAMALPAHRAASVSPAASLRGE